MSASISIYHHDDCLAHDTGPTHPESAQRIRAIMSRLRASKHLRHAQYIEAPLGSEEQVLLAHEESHLRAITARIPSSGRASLDPDTLLSPGSLRAALRGVGAACAGADALMAGEVQHVFCLTRPPGHHATAKRAMGFCLFNHIAIAALWLARRHGLARVAIVDFDVHHGNGTQDILGGREGMLYISTHQSPHYPGTGNKGENRAGNIANFPVHAGMGDEGYQALFEEQILPLLDDYSPECLLVSAGFDAHFRDPLAGMSLSEDSYGWLGARLRSLAGRHCDGRMLSVLEGGYNLDVLGASVEAYLVGAG